MAIVYIPVFPGWSYMWWVTDWSCETFMKLNVAFDVVQHVCFLDMTHTPQVRGVAAGGIVSTAFCLLYKLFTLKLTRKQLTAMINHKDSPYIRGIGFMYIRWARPRNGPDIVPISQSLCSFVSIYLFHVRVYRYCQPPPDFWDWFSPYFDDEEVRILFSRDLPAYSNSSEDLYPHMTTTITFLSFCTSSTRR